MNIKKLFPLHILNHINRVLSGCSTECKKDNVLFLLKEYKNIVKLFKYYHYELLISMPGKYGKIINSNLFKDLFYNKIIFSGYNIDSKVGYITHHDSLFINNLYSIFLCSQEGQDYYITFNFYNFINSFKNNIYGLPDSSGLISIDIISIKKGESFTKGLYIKDCLTDKKNFSIVFHSSFIYGKSNIYITCLQNIRGHRKINLQQRFYRYINYIIQLLGTLGNKKNIYSFQNDTHPCAWEKDVFKGDYNNIFKKRHFTEREKFLVCETENIKDEKISEQTKIKLKEGTITFYNQFIKNEEKNIDRSNFNKSM